MRAATARVLDVKLGDLFVGFYTNGIYLGYVFYYVLIRNWVSRKQIRDIINKQLLRRTTYDLRPMTNDQRCHK